MVKFKGIFAYREKIEERNYSRNYLNEHDRKIIKSCVKNCIITDFIRRIELAWSPLISVQSLRISNVARTREIEWNEQLDFPSGENNLVSPQTSPTESLLLLSSSPLEADVYSRENIFLAGKRERETAVWPSLAAATFYRLITPSPPPPPLCSSSLDFATPSLCRFPRRGRETRRGGAACKNPRVARENTCAVWPSLGCRRADPFYISSCRWIFPPPKWKIREKTVRFRVCANGFGECGTTNVSQPTFYPGEEEERKLGRVSRPPSSWREGFLTLFFFLSHPSSFE